MTERIRALDDLGAELARVAAEAERARRRPLRAGARAQAAAMALAIVAALCGTAYAVPATRAVLGGIAAPLAAWLAGEDDRAPGRAVRPGHRAPRWMEERGANEDDMRLIAEAGGAGLYVHRGAGREGPTIGFSLGQGRGITGTLESWRRQLGEDIVHVLGNSIFGGKRGVIDDRGRVPFFGVTTRDVERLELRYADGPALRSAAGDGGFVLLVDAWRRMSEIVAYDASGTAIGRADVSGYDLSDLCEKEPGCPPAG